MACFPSFFYFFLSIILVWHQAVCQQLVNNTFDDSDASISYAGNWQQSTATVLDWGGRHMIGLDPNATAVFNFHGVAVYFLAPLWPWNVTTLIQLDSGPPTILDLRDHNSPENVGGSETAASRVIMGMDNLDANQLHQLKISVMDEFAVVDGFIVTTINQTDSTTSAILKAAPATSSSSQIAASTTTALAATVSPSSREGRTGEPAVAIGVGVGLGVLVLLVAAIIFYYCYFRRSRTLRTSRQTDQPSDLEKYSLPSTIEPTPWHATSFIPTPPASDTGVTSNPSSSPLIQTSSGNLNSLPPNYDTVRLQPPTPPSHTRSILRRITFNRPPPAYHEGPDLHGHENYSVLELPQPATFCPKEQLST